MGTAVRPAETSPGPWQFPQRRRVPAPSENPLVGRRFLHGYDGNPTLGEMRQSGPYLTQLDQDQAQNSLLSAPTAGRKPNSGVSRG